MFAHHTLIMQILSCVKCHRRTRWLEVCDSCSAHCLSLVVESLAHHVSPSTPIIPLVSKKKEAQSGTTISPLDCEL